MTSGERRRIEHQEERIAVLQADLARFQEEQAAIIENLAVPVFCLQDVLKDAREQVAVLLPRLSGG